ncbi:MAG: GyrI-like domain-containing protein [Hyphomicrobiaceae bacterium]
MRPKQVVFVRSLGAYGASSQVAWKEMLAWIARQKIRPQIDCGYGVAHDYPGSTAAGDCRYDACIVLPEGFVSPRDDTLPFQTLPGGAFARMRHVGSYQTVRSSIALVRDRWLAKQPNLLADRRRPLMTVYFDNPGERPNDGLRCDVCIPVRTDHEDAFKRTKFTEVRAT